MTYSCKHGSHNVSKTSPPHSDCHNVCEMFSPLNMVATVNIMTAPEICLLHCDLLCGYKLSENFTTYDLIDMVCLKISHNVFENFTT